MASVYQINKGVNKPIEFKGLKSQYIWWLGGAIFLLFILYGFLYIIGLNQYLVIALVFPLGGFAVIQIYKLNNKYGEFGMMKMIARRALPRAVVCRSRKVFMKKKD